MRADDSEALIRQYHNTVSEADYRELETLLADDIVHNSPTINSQGRADTVKAIRQWRESFIEYRLDILYILTRGNEAIARLTVRGVYMPHSLLREPSGQRISLQALTLFRLADGQIQAVEIFFDPTVLQSELLVPCGLEVR